MEWQGWWSWVRIPLLKLLSRITTNFELRVDGSNCKCECRVFSNEWFAKDTDNRPLWRKYRVPEIQTAIRSLNQHVLVAIKCYGIIVNDTDHEWQIRDLNRSIDSIKHFLLKSRLNQALVSHCLDRWTHGTRLLPLWLVSREICGLGSVGNNFWVSGYAKQIGAVSIGRFQWKWVGIRTPKLIFPRTNNLSILRFRFFSSRSFSRWFGNWFDTSLEETDTARCLFSYTTSRDGSGFPIVPCECVLSANRLCSEVWAQCFHQTTCPWNSRLNVPGNVQMTTTC